MKNKNNIKLDDFKFKYKIDTRFRDLDAFKHVNNAVFLTYFETARRTLFNRWNINFSNRSLIIASININYLHQLKHPSSIIVAQKVSRIGNKSFDIYGSIFLNEIVISISTTTVVCYNFNNNYSVTVYDEIKKDFIFE